MSTPLSRRDTLALCGLSTLDVLAGRVRPALAAAELQDTAWIDTARRRDIPLRLRWPRKLSS